MSVIKAKRSEAPTQFYITMNKMEHQITSFMLKDFNVKKSNRNITMFIQKADLNKDEAKALKEIVENHPSINYEVSYPLWLFERYRNAIIEDLDDIKKAVIEGYTIYPGSEYEYNLKRGHIWEAISGCYKLLADIKSAIETFHPKSKEKYMPTVDLIETEIDLLKKWKINVKNQYKRIIEAMQRSENKKKLEKIEKEKSKTINTSSNVVEQNNVTTYNTVKYEPITPIHFIDTQDLKMNVSFDGLVEKSIITPIHFVKRIQ